MSTQTQRFLEDGGTRNGSHQDGLCSLPDGWPDIGKGDCTNDAGE